MVVINPGSQCGSQPSFPARVPNMGSQPLWANDYGGKNIPRICKLTRNPSELLSTELQIMLRLFRTLPGLGSVVFF
jgi:hypothetical protein